MNKRTSIRIEVARHNAVILSGARRGFAPGAVEGSAFAFLKKAVILSGYF